ncbi:uncharacterized protein L201_007382 [Kwoniella dendrophila CBS 6074]|uniref:Uncharacterized protein n=1 Tax=Kwoniella dendrophila CBS 6074 TaxID=1295534 RepID=A0AAX4K485_9TREE
MSRYHSSHHPSSSRPSGTSRYYKPYKSSSSGSRGHYRSGSRSNYPTYTNSSSRRRGFNPFICFKCSFGGKTVQSFLLILIPFLISVICFLTGFWRIPVWVYKNNQEKVQIASQGYAINGEDTSVKGFFYSTSSWPAPMNGFPLLLLFHLILSIIIITYLIFVISVCVYASHKRTSSLKSETWSRVIREPKWWERIICMLVTLITGTVLVLDNVVWGIARGKGYNVNPDILGYFVNIVALFLWVFWVVIQLASTHEIREYYVSGGGRVRR